MLSGHAKISFTIWLTLPEKKNSKAIRVLAKRLMNPSEIMHDTANKNGRHVGLPLPNK